MQRKRAKIVERRRLELEKLRLKLEKEKAATLHTQEGQVVEAGNTGSEAGNTCSDSEEGSESDIMSSVSFRGGRFQPCMGSALHIKVFKISGFAELCGLMDKTGECTNTHTQTHTHTHTHTHTYRRMRSMALKLRRMEKIFDENTRLNTIAVYYADENPPQIQFFFCELCGCSGQ